MEIFKLFEKNLFQTTYFYIRKNSFTFVLEKYIIRAKKSDAIIVVLKIM